MKNDKSTLQVHVDPPADHIFNTWVCFFKYLVFCILIIICDFKFQIFIKNRDCAMMCSTHGNSNCDFPFVYKNVTYTECTNTDSKDWTWCATGHDQNGQINKWDYCKKCQQVDKIVKKGK